MGLDPNESKTEVNRSSALSPEMMAFITASISTAVAEAVKATRLTKEDLRELRETRTEDQIAKDKARIKREARETMTSKADEAAARKETEERQSHCTHKHKNGSEALCLVHNFPDRHPRGLCPLNHCWVHPAEWRFPADPEQADALAKFYSTEARSGAYVHPAHRDYDRVRQLEAMQS